MTPDDALLAECLATPDDDAPRLVWADSAGGERGELVAIQCTLARGGNSPAESGALRRRERELLTTHGASWAAIGDLAKRCHFRRGFVEHVTLSAASFLEHGEALFDAAPFVRTVIIEGASAEHVPALVDHRCFPRLRGFGISGIEGKFPIADAALAAVIETDAYADLEALYLHRIGPEQTTALIATNQLAELTRLHLGIHTGEDASAVPPILATATNVRALAIDFVDETPELFDALPQQLTELAIRASALPRLSQQPQAAQIERLMLHGVTRGTLPELAAFSNLRVLGLDMGLYREPGLIEVGFADTPLPKLRELQATTEITPAAIRAIAEKLGPQLEYFHLPGTPSESLDDIRTLVAGEVYGHAYRASLTRPLWAGELPHEPNWPQFVRFPSH